MNLAEGDFLCTASRAVAMELKGQFGDHVVGALVHRCHPSRDGGAQQCLKRGTKSPHFGSEMGVVNLLSGTPTNATQGARVGVWVFFGALVFAQKLTEPNLAPRWASVARSSGVWGGEGGGIDRGRK